MANNAAINRTEVKTMRNSYWKQLLFVLLVQICKQDTMTIIQII